MIINTSEEFLGNSLDYTAIFTTYQFVALNKAHFV